MSSARTICSEVRTPDEADRRCQRCLQDAYGIDVGGATAAADLVVVNVETVAAASAGEAEDAVVVGIVNVGNIVSGVKQLDQLSA